MNERKKYGLIGKSLKHSFSKKYFTEKFDKERVDSVYVNYELNDIAAISELLEQPGLGGLNVTIPYKETVMAHLDQVSPVAREIGAVNTIQFKNGQSIGHNTDVFGFQQLIKPFFASQHSRAIVLGTGGASKAVAYVLEHLGCDIIYISRRPKGDAEFHYSEINRQMMESCKCIVNTTPVGQFPDVDEFPDIPYDYLTAEHLVIDLIYNPSRSTFLKKANEKGAIVVNGRTMLEQQAEASWKLWNDK